MTNVLIICGGKSPEHEISLRSARNVVKAINPSLWNIQIVGIHPDGHWVYLEEIPETKLLETGTSVWIDANEKAIKNNSLTLKPDVIFPVLHGPNGEDGSIQGLLQILDLPYVGPDILGSAVAMDKAVAKNELASHGLNVANGFCIWKGDHYSSDSIASELGLPLFVKPANMGSSVGVHKVKNLEEFEAAMADAFQYDTKVIIEEMITGRELECAVLGLRDNLKVTSPGEVKAEEEYSFEEKYSETSVTQLDIPAQGLSGEKIEEIKQTVLSAFKALNCEILSRVDMFLTPEGKIYVNEINTLPGFTSISMYPKLWENEGLSYSDLISELLELAITRHERNSQLKKSRL